MTCLPRLAAAFFGTALALTAVVAEAQPPTEERAFNDVQVAIAAFDRADNPDAMIRATQLVLDTTNQAIDAFLAADQRRDEADAQSHAKEDQRLELAVNCSNGFCDANGNLDTSKGWSYLTAAYARSYKAASALSAADADFVEAVNIPGAADEARARAERLKDVAARIRRLGDDPDVDVVNELIREANAEHRSLNALHLRGTFAHRTATQAALDVLKLAAGTLLTAAEQLTDNDTVTDSVERAREAAEPEVSVDSLRPDQAIEDLIDTTGTLMSVLNDKLAERESDQEDADLRADTSETVSNSELAIESAMAVDFIAWVRALHDTVELAERTAGEAEAAVAAIGSPFSRVTNCLAVHERLLQAVRSVLASTSGGSRPDFVSPDVGDQTWAELRGRLNAAQHRSVAACTSVDGSS